ncbi:MAG: ATP-binding cassette domain-containing protein [Pseudomonadota bacterium]
MHLIDATGLTKTFGEQTVVDAVSLRVTRGEVVGFLGPNGAGKSTTMRMITGFLDPDAGTTSICGYDVEHAAIAAKRHLGYLPEGAPGYADMTVANFLSFIGAVRGLTGPRLQDRLAEMVDRVNLAETWNKPIETLSKGFKRRVGIAQALIHDPDVLVLDEPTDGLDPNQKHEMRALISDIAPDKAIVVSTHILEEVSAICTRAVIIAAGKVVADDRPDALVAKTARQNALRISLNVSDADTAAAAITPLVNGGMVDVATRNGDFAHLIFDPGTTPVKAGDVVTQLAAKGIDVRGVEPVAPTLEDVFREITRAQSMS